MSVKLRYLIVFACLVGADGQCRDMIPDSIMAPDLGLALASPPAVMARQPTTNPASPAGIAGTAQKRPQSRKQSPAGRTHVADDPGCRWLDNRMDQLEAQLKVKNNRFVQGYRRELATRRREWQCLKCGAEGPSPADHSHCQHRR